MIGLIFATYEEAAPLLENIAANKEAGRAFATYRFTFGESAAGVIVLSGVGKVAAALATQYLILQYQPRLLINIGICGAVGPTRIGEVFCVTEAIEGDLARKFSLTYNCATENGPWRDLPKAKLTTRDIPVYDPLLRAEIAKWGLLVDMEGAAIARTCSLYNVPATLIKGVTDFADDGGEAAIARNIATVAAKLAAFLANNFSLFR